MQMPHRLTRFGAAVDHDAIPVAQLELPRETIGELERVPHQGRVGLSRIGQRSDMLFGNDQEMCGGLRIDVFEGHQIALFGNDLCRHLAADDAAEQTLG